MTGESKEPGADRRTGDRATAERILVIAPTADDARLASTILSRTGVEVCTLPDLQEAARELSVGAGLLVIASEALADLEGCRSIRAILDAQEPWSDVPILIIGTSADDEATLVAELLGTNAQTVLLERPLGLATFVTAIDAALRSRRRQYEVRRLLTELAEAAAALEIAHDEANRTKDEFLATLAHELRSPMTAISGWIQMLRLGHLDPAEAAGALAMIESSTKVQAHIIEDLMDVSRILAGKIMIEPALIDLAAVVTNIVATFRPAASLQGVDLTAAVPPAPVMILGDETRLQQVGWNLVSNAIKFTPSGGKVCVSLSAGDREAVIRVTDTGRGISPELLPHVFERYRQGDAAGRQRGLGLGLAIVRHLVESHGGTIEACSEGLGKGAEFVVVLPLRQE